MMCRRAHLGVHVGARWTPRRTSPLSSIPWAGGLGPRRQYTLEEKRRIVEETHIKGASVSTVARRYEANPNQVFAWR